MLPVEFIGFMIEGSADNSNASIHEAFGDFMQEILPISAHS
jgi:hypothetical protein